MLPLPPENTWSTAAGDQISLDGIVTAVLFCFLMKFLGHIPQSRLMTVLQSLSTNLVIVKANEKGHLISEAKLKMRLLSKEGTGRASANPLSSSLLAKFPLSNTSRIHLWISRNALMFLLMWLPDGFSSIWTFPFPTKWVMRWWGHQCDGGAVFDLGYPIFISVCSVLVPY